MCHRVAKNHRVVKNHRVAKNHRVVKNHRVATKVLKVWVNTHNFKSFDLKTQH